MSSCNWDSIGPVPGERSTVPTPMSSGGPFGAPEVRLPQRQIRHVLTTASRNRTTGAFGVNGRDRIGVAVQRQPPARPFLEIQFSPRLTPREWRFYGTRFFSWGPAVIWAWNICFPTVFISYEPVFPGSGIVAEPSGFVELRCGMPFPISRLRE